MLSVRQDAMFGAGHAKWGPLDPSILVLRPRPGALTFARAWRTWLLAEAEADAKVASTARGAAGGGGAAGGVAGGAAGWAERAAPLLTARLRRGAWPGIEELSVPGMRQNSRRAARRLRHTTRTWHMAHTCTCACTYMHMRMQHAHVARHALTLTPPDQPPTSISVSAIHPLPP